MKEGIKNKANERETLISKYGGFWLMEEQIEAKLAEVKTDSEKRAALKCQLQFR